MIKHLILLKLRNMVDIHVDLLQWSIMIKTILMKETVGGAINNENKSVKELAKELRKPIFRKFEKRKEYSLFIDNIWGV